MLPLASKTPRVESVKNKPNRHTCSLSWGCVVLITSARCPLDLRKVSRASCWARPLLELFISGRLPRNAKRRSTLPPVAILAQLHSAASTVADLHQGGRTCTCIQEGGNIFQNNTAKNVLFHFASATHIMCGPLATCSPASSDTVGQQRTPS